MKTRRLISAIFCYQNKNKKQQKKQFHFRNQLKSMEKTFDLGFFDETLDITDAW